MKKEDELPKEKAEEAKEVMKSIFELAQANKGLPETFAAALANSLIKVCHEVGMKEWQFADCCEAMKEGFRDHRRKKR